ncbi:unnamed protein product [Mytilus coruscus]|uniref:DZIP3-like HEPN domain-containing protein n=1 Tax=Mytilus coruscus TaxID=42192 RepID=A0A6J8C2P6_MYTCO|nr:unnamed protein product [Mytilus coruscus]
MTDLSTDCDKSSTIITEDEDENCLRIVHLLIRVATSAVRVKFDHEFYPGRLKSFLNQHRSKIDHLKGNRVISQAQSKLLFPESGNVSSDNFDVTLMICLIKNFTNIQVDDVIPNNSDQSEGADFTRLKYYRNKVMHSVGTMIDATFNEWWDEISQAIIRLGGIRFEEQCNIWKKRKLYSTDKEMLREIQNMSKITYSIPQGLRKICDDTVCEWKQENVVETRAIKQLKRLIETENVAIVIGPSGCGKSTAIHYIALQLKLLQDYEIIIVYSSEEIRQWYNPDNLQIFVIDDVFGAIAFDHNKSMKWLEMSNDINKILDGNRVKLLVSCRTHIFKHRVVKTINILSKSSCDFVSMDLCLTDDERQDIANFYLTKDEIRLLKLSGVFSKFDFFPLLCRHYSNQSDCNTVDFFSNPIKFVSDELYQLMTAYDQTTFATLFLFVVFNNCIQEILFTEKLKLKAILEDISDNFELKSMFSIQAVKDEMERLCNSYLRRRNTVYTIIHDKIFDILVYFCSQHKFDLLLDKAHTDVIRDRFICKSSLSRYPNHSNIDRGNPIGKGTTIYWDGETPLFKASSKGYTDIVELLLKQYADPNFGACLNELNHIEKVYPGTTVKSICNNNAIISRYSHEPRSSYKFNNRVERQSEDLHIFNNDQCKRTSNEHSTIVISYLKNVIYKKPSRFEQYKRYEISPLHIAASKGYKDIVKLLLSHNAEHGNVPDYSVIATPFCIASYQGYTDIVRLLLENKPNQYGRVQTRETLNLKEYSQSSLDISLHIAVQEGHYDIIGLILNHTKNFASYQEHLLRDLVTIATVKGHDKIVQLLLDQ